MVKSDKSWAPPEAAVVGTTAPPLQAPSQPVAAPSPAVPVARSVEARPEQGPEAPATTTKQEVPPTLTKVIYRPRVITQTKPPSKRKKKKYSWAMPSTEWSPQIGFEDSTAAAPKLKKSKRNQKKK